MTSSHELSREYREYERTSTVVMNAFVGPKVSRYIENLESLLSEKGFKGRFFLMESNGGVADAATIKQLPALLMESGPVGGIAGSIKLGETIQRGNLLTFDMGGTTAKAAMIEDGEAALDLDDVAPDHRVGESDDEVGECVDVGSRSATESVQERGAPEAGESGADVVGADGGEEVGDVAPQFGHHATEPEGHQPADRCVAPDGDEHLGDDVGHGRLDEIAGLGGGHRGQGGTEGLGVAQADLDSPRLALVGVAECLEGDRVTDLGSCGENVGARGDLAVRYGYSCGAEALLR